MLVLKNIEVMYNRVALALKNVYVAVPDKSIVCILGANGAGKSTVLKAVSGVLHFEEGDVTRGSIEYHGERIDGSDVGQVVKRGIAHVMEGRRVLEHLTVQQNLTLGAFGRKPSEANDRLRRAYHYFPALERLRNRTAGFLSGGEQQMLVIGRALMASPQLMLLDEPSLGLQPSIVTDVYAILRDLSVREGITLLIAEQNARCALAISDYCYVLENGRVVLNGPAAEVSKNQDISEFYLGMSEGRRFNYRDVKYYKRRKRWVG